MAADRRPRPPITVTDAALIELVGAFTEWAGKKEGLRFLRILARRLSTPPPSNVVGLHEDGPNSDAARDSLREWLALWLAQQDD